MMNGGQPIDPGLVQALGNISSSGEDQSNLKTQMALASALRSQQPPPGMTSNGGTQMAGRVAVRASPVATAAQAGQNILAQFQQAKVLRDMQAQASMLRDARGKIISQAQAQYNANTDPTKNHPDTNAQLGVGGGAADPTGGINPESGIGDAISANLPAGM
jgi:hypothetical protein